MNYSNLKLGAKDRIKTLTAFTAAAILLSACGGGGGGSDSSSTSASAQQSITINTFENTTETRQFNGDIDPTSITPVSGFDSPNVSQSTDGNSLTILVGDLENSTTERFTLKTSSGITYTIAVNALNASAQATVQQAETLTEITAPESLVGDDLRLLNTVLEIEFLAGKISESEKASISSAAAEAINGFSGPLENEIALLDQTLTNYKAGDVTETDLEQRLAAAAATLSNIGNAGEDALGNVTDTLAAMGITLPADLEATNPLVYVESAERFSRYMNSDFGSFDANENFTFSSSYDFFNAVFPYAAQ
jgi:exonuclease VII small subunit